MAVKQLLIEHADTATTDARLQLLLRQHELASRSGHRRDEICISMVIGLGACTVPEDATKFKKFIADLQKVEELLKQECSNLDLLYATLRALYNEISDTSKSPLSPAMSIVLRLIPTEMIPEAVKWILNSGYQAASLERALSNLCQWLSKWTYTPNLSPLVILLMEALEEDHADILVKVTLEYIEALFKLLILEDFRKNVGPVVFYMLCKVQNTPEVYEKILGQIVNVVGFLQRENSEDSQLYVQKIVGLCAKVKNICPHYHAIEEHLETVIDAFSCDKRTEATFASCKPWAPKNPELVQGEGFKVGLNNLGNTCYMNSVLQALYMTKLFRNDILTFDHNGMPLFHNVQDLFALLQHSNRLALSPYNILQIARPAGFHEGHQHDSSEFLLHLLDILHEQEVKESKTDEAEPAASSGSNTLPNTIVQQSFGGRSMTVFTCGQCSSHSEKIDNFRELPLCFPDEDEQEYTNHSISSLLDFYLQPEKLCGDNKYHCEKCGLIDGEKVTRVIQAPRRLIMTLKHFKYDVKSCKRTKLLHRVKLEEYIQLNDTGYELYAAVVHHGNDTDHGHYYALAKEDEKWYKFNDNLVKKLNQNHIYELQPPETPYILFYRSQQSEEPDNLEKTSLPSRLQEVVHKDYADKKKEEERRKNSTFTYKTRQNKNNDDPPPPPAGCGDGFSNTSSNMYVF